MGPATSATLGETLGVVADAFGNVFVADGGNSLLLKITPNGVLTVVAGNGIRGYSGDGGLATSASLNLPIGGGAQAGVAVDAAGNLYVADTASHRIRKVNPDGKISTVAGGVGAGFSGDGGPATSASLNIPTGVTVDAAGNLYIADNFNNRIRRVSPNGTITTVAGNGVAAFSGDGGPATAASLNRPSAVAVDGGANLYIAEEVNRRIRKVTPQGTISTVAGGGTGGDGSLATMADLGTPRGIAVDRAGNLYIADTPGNRIRKVGLDGKIFLFAGAFGGPGFSGDGGPAAAALLDSPFAMAVDAAGNVFITDTGNERIRRVDARGTISTFAGSGVFKFAGDGGPATSAALNFPRSVALGSDGTIYIADTLNHRVRKVGSDGIITTIAGTGERGSTGDGGPATAAKLNRPQSVGLDAGGNLYIAEGSLIRKVTPAGVISTVAGNGTSGFSGDGGPATRASLTFSAGIAFDTSGNLYFADGGNHRIRKVTPAGIISTVAGNGTPGFSGDGGPALNAALNFPNGVAVDRAGNLYIADNLNLRIRKVSLNGVISTVAGGGTGGDGGPATAASLVSATGVALDASGNILISGGPNIRKVGPDGVMSTVAGGASGGFGGDGGAATSAKLRATAFVAVASDGSLFIADAGNDRIRKVQTTAPTFSATPTSLSFSTSAGAADIPVQQVSISSSLTGLAWSAEATTSSGGSWLLFKPSSGSAPGTLQVKANAVGLAAGTYRGAITLRAPGATPPSLAVAVDLVLQAEAKAQLAVQPASLSFEAVSGAGNPGPQTLQISNAGGGTLNWTARAETTRGGNWLSVSSASGSASPGSPSSLQVSVNASGPTAGVYSGTVRVESSATGEVASVAVALLLAEAKTTILLSQAGLLFTGVEGGSVVPSQSFAVLNTGQGIMSWTATASTLSGGNWLSLSQGSGQSDATSLDIPLVDVAVNVTGLKTGRYSGLIRISATGANNSPQFVTVELNVLPAGSRPDVVVQPAGMVFAARASGSSPSSQTVRVATAKPASVEFLTGLVAFGGDWLEVQPHSAVISPTDSKTIVVQPSLGSLAAGLYRGALTLLFADGSRSQVVDVLFVVAPAATAAAGPCPGGACPALRAELPTGSPAAECTPARLYAALRTLGSNFTSPAGWPSSIEAQVLDDCGTAVANATVVASFSNGDPSLPLTSLRNGLYSATWRPVTTASQVTVTLRASLTGLTAAEVQVLGQVSTNANVAALYSGGVVSGASFAKSATLAPGGIVSVFGRSLASATAAASSLPLPTSLGGASLNVAGTDAPLFFVSDGQINAQLPFELSAATRPQIFVRTRREATGTESLTVPETIATAPAQPAIFTTNQQGTGQGAILNAQGRLVDSTAPAAAGEVVQIFCSGLGATNPTVISGQAAPSAEPLARVTTPVEARIGGKPATVQFAGLAPGFVGLYQVNAQIPEGVTPGNSVELVLSQSGVPSNTVTLAIR